MKREDIMDGLLSGDVGDSERRRFRLNTLPDSDLSSSFCGASGSIFLPSYPVAKTRSVRNRAFPSYLSGLRG